MFTTHISYLEIYNDKGYDLLDPKHEASKLENLPLVKYCIDMTIVTLYLTVKLLC